MRLDLETGLIDSAKYVPSPNCDERDAGNEPEVVIIHCISLPSGEYGGGHVQEFFQNKLNASEHCYFKEISHLQVSSHFFIERGGVITQFVPTNKRAWHAGESVCLERPKVNNFSIGVELEGLDIDTEGYTAAQYDSLTALLKQLQKAYPKILKTNIFAHSDIAPGRKTDPGPFFDWKKIIE